MTSPLRIRPYEGRTVAVGTLHGKQRQFAPAFARWHGMSACGTSALDTDLLGTFAGEVPRTLAPVEAAEAKAVAATEERGETLGVATEGSYVSSAGGFGPVVHEEVAVFVDRERGTRIVETMRGFAAAPAPVTLRERAGLEVTLRRLGFPENALIIRMPDGTIHKGITDRAALEWVVAEARATGPVTLERDLRAHHNPSRQRVLRRLAWVLAARLGTPCPSCRAPGFGRVAVIRGLPCAWCGEPTRRSRAEMHGCVVCGERVEVDLGQASADPGSCDQCNP